MTVRLLPRPSQLALLLAVAAVAFLSALSASAQEAEVVHVRENGRLTSGTNDMAIFGELRVEPGVRLQIDAGAVVTVHTRLVVEQGAFLNVEGTIRFGPEARLVVYGDASATGAFLVAADPTAGWRGVHLTRRPGETFAQPLPLTWVDTRVSGVTLVPTEEPSRGDPAAVVVFERDFRMQGGVIERTRGGAGLYVAQGTALLSNSAILQFNEGAGLVAGPSGVVHTALEGPEADGVLIRGNTGGGVSASGANALVHLLGATVELNFGPGVAATDGGRVYLSLSSRTTVSDNYEGLSATNGGVVYVGDGQTSGGQTTCNAPPDGHSFPDHAHGERYVDARSLAGSVLYAEGNRRGDALDPEDLVRISDFQSSLSGCLFPSGKMLLCDGTEGALRLDLGADGPARVEARRFVVVR